MERTVYSLSLASGQNIEAYHHALLLSERGRRKKKEEQRDQRQDTDEQFLSL